MDDERRLSDESAVDQFEVYRALDQAQRMVDIALNTFRECREHTTSMVELCSSEEELKPVLAQFLHRSSHTPVQLFTVWSPQQKIETHPSLLRQLAQHPGGNKVYILARPDAAMSPEGETQLDELNSRHSKVRVHHERLPNLTILNRRIAILRTAADDGPSKIFLINATDIVRSLSLLYTATWERAIDLDEFRQHGIERDDDIASQVLDLLSNGCKDETAARQLGLSVRTYRRYVAGLMDRLAATSRFQAGAQAARLGLIGGVPEQRSGRPA
jgi:DNA-binding CsgD family transcriptional regulator